MILDHHKSAMDDLKNEAGCFFDMSHSGAVLAWHYFFGLDTTPPLFLQLIQDRDLLRWDMREMSEALSYALYETFSQS